MRRTPALCFFTLLLAIGGAPSEAAPKSAKGPWKVAPNDFVHYQLDVDKYGSGDRTDQQPDEPMRGAFGVFGYELADGRRPHRSLRDEPWLIFPYVLWMPRTLVTKGRTVQINDVFEEWGRQHATIRGRGKLTSTALRKEGDTHEVDLAGTVIFESKPHPQYVRGGAPKGSGTLRWQATFDLAEGLMRRVTFALSVDRAGYDQRLVFDGTLVLHRKFAYRYEGFEADVAKAVERGMKAMRTYRDDDGVWAKRSGYPMGESALGLLTLVKGGWDRADTDLQKVVDWMVGQAPEGTYSVALALAAIEAWRAPDRELGTGEKRADGSHGTRVLTKAERTFAERMTKFLLERAKIGTNDPRQGQRGNGASKKRKKKRGKRSPLTGDSEYIRWSYAAKSRGGIGVQITGANPDNAWDNSNTQYAALGLHSASLCDVDVPRHVWFKVLGHWLRHQRFDGPARPDFELREEDDGATRYETSSRYRTNARSRGWGYQHLERDHESEWTAAYGSMTCGGISSLAIADGALVRLGVKRYGKAERKRVAEAIRDGFASLDEHWSVWSNPNMGSYHYFYYLYGLERAAMLTGVKWIGDHDWYWEGAIHLLLAQEDNGRWNNRLVETAFAVLFLKRGTKAVITPR